MATGGTTRRGFPTSGARPSQPNDRHRLSRIIDAVTLLRAAIDGRNDAPVYHNNLAQ